MSARVVLRPAAPQDAAAVAEVKLRASRAALPTVRSPHADDDVRAWVAEVLVPAGGVWVAEVEGTVVGMLALSPGWVEQLYVDPAWQDRRIGTRLLAHAQQLQPSGLQLWTFQVNAGAQRFYERHGFTAVERTDGAGNEEREPDVRYAWPGRTDGV